MRTETPRLLLREWRLSDFEPYADYYADPALARYVGGHLGREAAWRHMATHAGHWALLGYGYWAVEEKASSDLVGGLGLWHSDGWPELELGYWLMPEKQGKGYATEAGKRALDYAWEDVGAKSLVGGVVDRMCLV